MRLAYSSLSLQPTGLAVFRASVVFADFRVIRILCVHRGPRPLWKKNILFATPIDLHSGFSILCICVHSKTEKFFLLFQFWCKTKNNEQKYTFFLTKHNWIFPFCRKKTVVTCSACSVLWLCCWVPLLLRYIVQRLAFVVQFTTKSLAGISLRPRPKNLWSLYSIKESWKYVFNVSPSVQTVAETDGARGGVPNSNTSVLFLIGRSKVLKFQGQSLVGKLWLVSPWLESWTKTSLVC